MLNTLANHGFLPREGRDFTLPVVKNALRQALNVSEDISEMLFNFAITTNPAPNATTWGLDTLGNHNILEHDASLRSVLASHEHLEDPVHSLSSHIQVDLNASLT
jgi:hypothetical protein